MAILEDEVMAKLNPFDSYQLQMAYQQQMAYRQQAAISASQKQLQQYAGSKSRHEQRKNDELLLLLTDEEI